jgi:hypothetical protein
LLPVQLLLPVLLPPEYVISKNLDSIFERSALSYARTDLFHLHDISKTIQVDVVLTSKYFKISSALGLFISKAYQDIHDVKSSQLRDRIILSHDSKDAQSLGETKSISGLSASTLKG